MKKLFLSAAVLLNTLVCINHVHAQWTTVGSVISQTDTTKKVSIGTKSNTSDLYVARNNAAAAIGVRSGTSNAILNMDKGSAGSNSAVAYKSQGVTSWNTGMLGNNNYSIKNVVSGTFPLVINTADNVGIGTSSPGYKLQVIGTGRFEDGVKIGGFGVVNVDAPGTVAGRFKIDSAGNVGIGVTNPTFKLEVAGDAKINGVFVGRGNGAITTNTAVGDGALNANTTGFNNTAVGNFALDFNTIGINNTAVGIFSLYSNINGERNTSMGYQSLLNNIDGSYNSAFGSQALTKNTSGTNNTANGFKALEANTTATDNTAVGFQALLNDSTGSNNTAVGSGALTLDVNGFNNTAVGFNALTSNTTGSYNTATGKEALLNNTTSTGNSAFGYWALKNDTTGNNNTGLGTYADITKGGISNATAVGYAAKVDTSNKVRIGNGSVSSIGGQVSWTSFSDARIKDNVQEINHGLDFINELRPVTFHYNVDKENALIGVENNENWAGKKDIEKIAFSGFLAQEVDAAAKKVGYDFSGVDKNGKILGLRYSEFVVPLVKGMQELSAENKAMQTNLAKTINENEQLKQTVAEMKSCIETLCNSASTSNSRIEEKTEQNVLFQNQPNPFSETTVIGYQLTGNYNSAKVIIRNLNGEIMRTIVINQNEKGEVTLHANELKQGTYTYSLMLNDKCADTKLMVITK